MRTHRWFPTERHPASAFVVWLAAIHASARAHIVGWNAAGVVPTVLFLTEAERAGQTMLPDPEAYSHALTLPATPR